MSQTIAIFNQAGGVAKSTLTMNLGYEIAQRGQRVLLIDLDPQATLCDFMSLESWDFPHTIYDCLLGNVPAQQTLRTGHGIDILPANLSLSKAELELYHLPMREQRLLKVLAPISQNYDTILIDCPPSLGVLSYLALVTADRVLVPLECEYKSYKGTDLVLGTIANVRQEANPKLGIVAFAPVKFSSSRSQHQRVLSAIQAQLSPIAPVAQPIPDAIAFVDASEQKLPLALYDRRHKALEPLRALASLLVSTTEREIVHA